jgi:hypothetical protein
MLGWDTLMAIFKPKPGTVTVIKGDLIQVMDLYWCEQCKLHHVDKDHASKHQEPVEPAIKEHKIAGLLPYSIL